MSNHTDPKLAQHWASTRNLTIGVLIVWFIFSLLLPWYAKELNSMSFLGFKLGYYLVVQGSLIVFVLLIWLQNVIQDSIDRSAGVNDE